MNGEMHACVFLAPGSQPAELVLELVQLLAALAQLQLQAVLPDFQLTLQGLGAPGGRGQAPAKLLILLLQQPARVRGQGQRGIREGSPGALGWAQKGRSRDDMRIGRWGQGAP